MPSTKESAFVYFIRGGNRVKIGRSNDPKSRLAMLQVGSPVKLEIVHIIQCSSLEHSILVENCLHHVFGQIRERGEWFKLTPSLRKFIRACETGCEGYAAKILAQRVPGMSPRSLAR